MQNVPVYGCFQMCMEFYRVVVLDTGLGFETGLRAIFKGLESKHFDTVVPPS